jgi:hypothetical protein
VKPGPHQPWAGRVERVTDIYHHVVSRHQVEVEVWPARAELNFQDERWANPANTQIRFEAIVYNSRAHVLWEVRDLAGNPGLGSIDASGLYRAPLKGGSASGSTDVVVATSTEDPLRKAFAWVALIGKGPEPAPAPNITMWPKRAVLYYQMGSDNSFIDDSNKRRLFNATLRNSPATNIEWLVNNAVAQAGANPWFLYQAPGSGLVQDVTIVARIQATPGINDDAKVTLLNYVWPGLH